MELQEEASVAELKEVVGSQQGVEPEQLRVLFAGRELRSTATLQVRRRTRAPGRRTSLCLDFAASSFKNHFLLLLSSALILLLLLS